jgi:hypothetical protein
MKNIFVQTVNVQNFYTVLKDAESVNGSPAFVVTTGQAGRGKTLAARTLSANEGWTYVRALMGWTELWMLQDLCFELRVDPIPKRKKPAFEAVKAALIRQRRIMIIDDSDKLSPTLLEWLRDLADVTESVFCLVGEKLIRHKMERERRIWSRTLRSIEFLPIQAKDIMFFAKQAADIRLTPDQAVKLQQASDGDFRLVDRDMRRIEQLLIANNVPPDSPTDKIVDMAIKQGLRGK